MVSFRNFAVDGPEWNHRLSFGRATPHPLGKRLCGAAAEKGGRVTIPVSAPPAYRDILRVPIDYQLGAAVAFRDDKKALDRKDRELHFAGVAEPATLSGYLATSPAACGHP